MIYKCIDTAAQKYYLCQHTTCRMSTSIVTTCHAKNGVKITKKKNISRYAISNKLSNNKNMKKTCIQNKRNITIWEKQTRTFLTVNRHINMYKGVNYVLLGRKNQIHTK